MKEVTYKNGTKSKILIFKFHGVLLYFVRVLMVFPIVGTVTWYYGNLIVLFVDGFAQEKNSCSLVLKLKVFRSLYFRVFTGAVHKVYHGAALFKKKCTRYFFQRDTSSESNCNRSFRGQPSGWNRLLVVMCTSTRVLPLISTNFKQQAIPLYHFIWVSIFYFLE